MSDIDLVFDLQLFAEEAAEAETETGTEAAAGTETTAGNESEGEKTNETLLGKETETLAKNTANTGEYDFKSYVPSGMEYDADKAQEFSALAKEIGLNKEQAEKLAAYGMNYMQGGVNAFREAKMNEIKSWGEAAKNTLGVDYEKVVDKAAKGIEALEAQLPGLRKALNETGAGNRIEIIRMAAIVGDLVSEDTFKGFGAMATGHGQDDLYGNTDFSKY